MNKFKVITDTTSDLPEDIRKKYNIDYMMMSFNDGKTQYDADIDFKELSAKDFYDKMRNGVTFKTSQVQMTEIGHKLNKYLSEGLDVLYVACSSQLTGSCNFVRVNAPDLLDRYPDRRIICFDTLRSTGGEGLLAIKASLLADQGLSVEEAYKILNEEKLNYNCICTVDSLEWLKKAGRIKSTRAFFGNLLSVKPIIVADANGNNFAYKKVKGRKNSLEFILEEIKNRIINPEERIVFLEHADDIESLNYIKEKIEKEIKPKEIIVTNIGPIIGATVGPNSIIVSFYGQKVTLNA